MSFVNKENKKEKGGKQTFAFYFRNPLRFVFLFILMSLFSLFLIIYNIKQLQKKNLNSPAALDNASYQELRSNNQVEEWDLYENKKYGFSLRVPKLLLKRESENKGGYLFFVRFEENKFSKNKGVAFGVSDLSLQEEEKRIIGSFEKSGFSEKPIRQDFKVKNYQGVRLDYSQSDVHEARALIIFNNGKFTYSVSTVPEQIDRIIEDLELFD